MKRAEYAINKILDVAIVLVWSGILFYICKVIAEYQRGYAAFGGEYIVLFAPIIIYIACCKRKSNKRKSNKRKSNKHNEQVGGCRNV